MRIEYRQLCRPYAFSSPFEGKSFALYLHIADGAVTAEEQSMLSAAIVRQGCRYAVCAGCKCSSWDDSIDMADLERNNWEINDATFVMTSWHEKESTEDIVCFFLNDTSFDDWTADNLLVAVVGDDVGTLDQVRKEVERQRLK